MRVGLAADHEGYELKEQILGSATLGGELEDVEFLDFGAWSFNPDDDYPDYVIPLAKAAAENKIARGIAICGSGIGASIAANKVHNARAAVVQDLFSVRQGVEDDDVNVICLGSRLVSLPLALEIVHLFLKTNFSHAPRHRRRLMKIQNFEQRGLHS